MQSLMKTPGATSNVVDLPTTSCTLDKLPEIIQIKQITNFDLDLVILDFNGKVTTQKRSIPIAIFVQTLAVTDSTWVYRTIGHIGDENIQFFSMVIVNVKGIQNTAIIKSAMARLIRNKRKSDRERFPKVNTKMTRVFPMTARRVVHVYNMISVTCDSIGNGGGGPIGTFSCTELVSNVSIDPFVKFQLVPLIFDTSGRSGITMYPGRGTVSLGRIDTSVTPLIDTSE